MGHVRPLAVEPREAPLCAAPLASGVPPLPEFFYARSIQAAAPAGSSTQSQVSTARSRRRSHASCTTDARPSLQFGLLDEGGGAWSASIARLIRTHTSRPSSSHRWTIKC
jgi:hypothetical protein